MILKEVSKFLPNLCAQGRAKGLQVTISVPKGEELARHTFNPRLGIVGGISIIGTTGIVEPKSQDAYKASLALELDVLNAQGYKEAVFVLGYIGEKFCLDVRAYGNTPLHLDNRIKIGDHIGFMLEQCAKKGIKKCLLIGHIGKLIKVSNGQFNTHYKFGDNRVSSIAKYVEACGAQKEVLEEILRQTTAEATIEILRKNGFTKAFDKIAQDVSTKLEEFVRNKVKIDCIILSLKGEVLGESVHNRHRARQRRLSNSYSQRPDRKS